jgi:hypothetical protein
MVRECHIVTDCHNVLDCHNAIDCHNATDGHNVTDCHLHLLCDLLSGRNECGGATFAGVVGLDDVLAVADAIMRHQWRHCKEGMT